VIIAGLRTLKVIRVSVVLKACLVFSVVPAHIWISFRQLSSWREFWLDAVNKQT